MDYFLDIPSDTKDGGLVDVYLKINNQMGSRSSLNTHLHYFSLSNNVLDPDQPELALNKGLGVELDAIYSLKINPEVEWSVGWSFILPTETMRILRNGDKGVFNTWAWTMVVFKPNFFKTKEE
jgi:hypothetical protein